MATDVATVAVRGAWFKHTYPGSQPLPERKPPPDNRWQRGDVVDALYLAEAEETTWAEWYRHLAERMIPPLAQMPRELWTWRAQRPDPLPLSRRARSTGRRAGAAPAQGHRAAASANRATDITAETTGSQAVTK